MRLAGNDQTHQQKGDSFSLPNEPMRALVRQRDAQWEPHLTFGTFRPEFDEVEGTEWFWRCLSLNDKPALLHSRNRVVQAAGSQAMKHPIRCQDSISPYFSTHCWASGVIGVNRVTDRDFRSIHRQPSVEISFSSLGPFGNTNRRGETEGGKITIFLWRRQEENEPRCRQAASWPPWARSSPGCQGCSFDSGNVVGDGRTFGSS